ncbi:uncharacterized protein N7483_006264 [Penicillium malachiteum]|uniref:uncharacterized protein n=1 Tax=Penicillium malachiteum TaxID=1324776 RepID=UPI0025498812|nr:uncharacterized protein N7483_006264 [Penicillium malachiteum]KAJ5731756.1 hypothetical protein N7483_006264 [Penicillium malachiteum]
MTREAWLGQMEKDHGGNEQWVCQACSQKGIQAIFEKPTKFVAHLEQQHGKRVGPRQIPILLSAWRRTLPFTISNCPLCFFESEDQKVFLDHTAEHIHSFSLRSLPWAPREGFDEEDDDEACGADFKLNSYFEIDSSQSEPSSMFSRIPSPATDSGSITGSDSQEKSPQLDEQQQQLTEDMTDRLSGSMKKPKYMAD